MEKIMTAFIDITHGISGDMLLGAMLDAGLPDDLLRVQLNKCPISGYELRTEKNSHMISGTDINVTIHSEQQLRTLVDVEQVLNQCELSDKIVSLSKKAFHIIADAEAHAHGLSKDDVHFHELGSIDTFIDIVGCMIGYYYLNIDELIASPIPFGQGEINTAHGRIPLPCPAVVAMIKGLPICASNRRDELVTPTGLAIVKALASHFGENPLQSIHVLGTGFGDRYSIQVPDMARLYIGHGAVCMHVETNIDDMSAEMIGPMIAQLLALGANDAYIEPIYMKKNRPAYCVHVIVSKQYLDICMDYLLTSTTTFGVRYYPVERRVLQRELVSQTVDAETIQFKIGRLQGGAVVKVIPEFDSVEKFALKKSIPIYQAYHYAMRIAEGIYQQSDNS